MAADSRPPCLRKVRVSTEGQDNRWGFRAMVCGHRRVAFEVHAWCMVRACARTRSLSSTRASLRSVADSAPVTRPFSRCMLPCTLTSSNSRLPVVCGSGWPSMEHAGVQCEEITRYAKFFYIYLRAHLFNARQRVALSPRAAGGAPVAGSIIRFSLPCTGKKFESKRGVVVRHAACLGVLWTGRFHFHLA